jgi:hypothetical protein
MTVRFYTYHPYDLPSLQRYTESIGTEAIACSVPGVTH